MEKIMHMSRGEARKYLIAYHFERPVSRAVDQIEATIRKLRCVQYDPLNVVGRNHDLVLQSRIPGYHPGDLERFMYADAPRALVEGFDKNLSVFASEDWPHLQRLGRGLEERFGSHPAVQEHLPEVRKMLKERPLRAEDLPWDEKVRWPWGQTRLARALLETLWYAGEAVVHHREGARRWYADAGQMLPEAVAGAMGQQEPDADYFAWHVERRIQGIGLVRPSGDAYLCIDGMKAAARAQALDRLQEAGAVLPVRIEGMPEGRMYYMPAEGRTVLDRIRSGFRPNAVHILGPLDNLIWDRTLIRALFSFDYTWEVYTPVAKRRYGYYVLPVVRGDRFVARFDPVRYRGGPGFEIARWWWEGDIRPDADLCNEVKTAVDTFAGYLGAKRIRMPRNWKTNRRSQ